ncbi:hypothetical protein B0T20DRAFT_233573 [Sordaria brevicollis]|uniref:Uncharacterized protein n=1 Tax=Sordaria brevicollis TaxID=83679 RepID=A0AAE0PDB6_SORBR|nr:hypothetical protein B0T20DRAFT_233573 [Sordaria brevicollis]
MLLGVLSKALCSLDTLALSFQLSGFLFSLFRVRTQHADQPDERALSLALDAIGNGCLVHRALGEITSTQLHGSGGLLIQTKGAIERRRAPLRRASS